MALILQMTWQNQRRRRQPMGLRNLGNTCYLNSVLQCLIYTPPLAQFCLSNQHSATCKVLKECVFCILERQIVRSLTLEGSVMDSPIKIQKCLSLLGENFRLGRQEDAHEFLRYVIDACHNTCVKRIKKIPSASSSSSNGSSVGPSSMMKEIFGGELLSQVKCLSCKGESNKADEIMDISLDIFQTNSLKDALGRFFQPEVLDGNNKYNCCRCKKLSVAKKQMFVLRAPNVLVIQFKRFEGIHGGKINKNIEFEECLLLSKFMCSTTQDLQPEYSLFGSIVHSGFSPESGHYYAYIKDPLGRWYCCNDAHVSLSSTQEVLSEKAYILFYLRNNQSPKPDKTASACNSKTSAPSGSGVSIVRPNVLSSYKNNNSTILKNGKVAANQQMKFNNNIKNLEINKVVSNGNGNHVVHANGSNVKYGEHKLAPAGKENATPHSNGSLDKSKVENGVDLPSLKSITNKLESGRKQILQVVNGNGHSNLSKVNGNGHCNLPKVEKHEDSSTQNLAAVDRAQDHDHPSKNMLVKDEVIITTLKRKSCNADEDDSMEGYTNKSTNLTRNDTLCKTRTLCEGNRRAELENFKELISSEAASFLRSCGWVDKVQSSMRITKRLCTQAAGSLSGNTELRTQLKVDAKKQFLSQIPESLKEHLIERLLSFSEGEHSPGG